MELCEKLAYVQVAIGAIGTVLKDIEGPSYHPLNEALIVLRDVEEDLRQRIKIKQQT